MALIEKPGPQIPIPEPLTLTGELPALPDDVLKRFKSLEDWGDDMTTWWKRVKQEIYAAQDTFQSSTNDQINKTNTSIVSVTGGFTAAILAEQTARTTADSALASSITSVIAGYTAADTALSAAITTEQTARVTADSALATSITSVIAAYQAADTALQANITSEATSRASADSAEATARTSADATLTTAIGTVSASVITEATARVAADGFLSGKYTLTVTAGNVVTGMNLTSSTNGGVDTSDVTFIASNFKIYNGTTGMVMFSVSGTDVMLAGTLVVSTDGKVYIGTGNYASPDTQWYVDSSGNMSLKDRFTWDGTTLTISGVIDASTISGGTLTIDDDGAVRIARSNFQNTFDGISIRTIGFEIGHWTEYDAITFIDFHAEPSVDNSARIIRYNGVDGEFAMEQTGLGDFTIRRWDNGDIFFDFQGTGYMRFGTFNPGAPVPTGYVEFKDAGGTVRQLLVA